VYVALHAGTRILSRKPDAVVSGMNLGVNLGDDVFYSGTVAAAREGALKGIPSLALSAELDVDAEAATQLGARLVSALLATARGETLLLNVNVPSGKSWPVRATRLGARIYRDEVDFRRDPRGREYLWIGGPGAEHRAVAGSDTEAHDQGIASVTPLVLDLWNRSAQESAELIVQSLPK
jgi:5'-nucleotidase